MNEDHWEMGPDAAGSAPGRSHRVQAGDIIDGLEVYDVTTRQELLDDGALIAADAEARRVVALLIPTAYTVLVYGTLGLLAQTDGQRVRTEISILGAARNAFLTAESATESIFPFEWRGTALILDIHSGDDGETVATVMLAGED